MQISEGRSPHSSQRGKGEAWRRQGGGQGNGPGTSAGAEAGGMPVTRDIHRRGGSRANHAAAASRYTAPRSAALPLDTTQQSAYTRPDHETVTVLATAAASSSRARRHSSAAGGAARLVAHIGVCQTTVCVRDTAARTARKPLRATTAARAPESHMCGPQCWHRA